MNALEQKKAILAALGSAGAAFNPQQLSPSLLRRDSSALGTQGNVDFNFQQAAGSTASKTSILLGINDSFVVTDIALRIKKCEDTDAGHAAAISYNHYSNLVFTQTNDANLQAIYNSVLSAMIDNYRYLPSMATELLERIPDTQAKTTTTAYVNAATADATTVIARDAKPHALFGFMPVSPFVLKGNNESQEISIKLPTSLALAATGSDENFATLVFNGYLIANSVK